MSTNKINWTYQDECQRIDTGLKDVDEVGADDANARQLAKDGRHEDAEHSSSIQVLQRCKETWFFLLPLYLPGQVPYIQLPNYVWGSPDYKSCLLSYALAFFTSQCFKQVCETSNVSSSNEFVRSHWQEDEQHKAEPTMEETKEKAVIQPA